MAHTGAAAAGEVQEPRSGNACSPGALLPAASQGREEMLSQGTMCTAGPMAMQHPMQSPSLPCALPWAVRLLWGALTCHPLLSPSALLLRHGMDAALVGTGLPHAFPSPHREAPAKQVEGFLPLPITHISPVN